MILRAVTFHATGLLWLLGAIMLAGCESEDRGAGSDDADVRPAAEATERQRGTGFAPVAYFQQNCASCHGNYGSGYPEQWTAVWPADVPELRRSIQAMAEMNAGLPLEAGHLEVQAAYHLSMADGRPFLSVTEGPDVRAGPRVLNGEATPRSSVELQFDGKTVTAEVEGHSWSAMLPEGIELADVRVVARRGGVETALDLSVASHSHAPGAEE